MDGDTLLDFRSNYGKTHGEPNMKWIKKLFNKNEEIVEQPIEVEKPKRKVVRKSKISEKDQATARKESYIKVLDTQIDSKNPSNGYFELDWNSYFVDELKKAGYTGATEEEIVDKWFKALCQNIVAEDDQNREVRIV